MCSLGRYSPPFVIELLRGADKEDAALSARILFWCVGAAPKNSDARLPDSRSMRVGNGLNTIKLESNP